MIGFTSLLAVIDIIFINLNSLAKVYKESQKIASGVSRVQAAGCQVCKDKPDSNHQLSR